MIQRLLNGILDRRTTFSPPLKTTFSSVSSPRIRGHKRHSNLGELSWNKRGLAALAVIGRRFLPSLGNRGGVGLMIHLYQLCIAICSPCLSHSVPKESREHCSQSSEARYNAVLFYNHSFPSLVFLRSLLQSLSMVLAIFG